MMPEGCSVSALKKVIINSALFDNIELVSQIAEIYGAQSIIASVDVRKDLFGKYKVYSNSGQKKKRLNCLTGFSAWSQQVSGKFC